MGALTEFLLEEHRELAPRIESLRETADSMFLEPTEEVAKDIEESIGFIDGTLVPHARTEEEVLYPAFERLLGTPVAMQLVVRDHKEIMKLASELAAFGPQPWEDELSHEERKRFRRLLYSLYAVIQLHFAKEEEILLPLLESRLQPDQANALLASLKAKL